MKLTAFEKYQALRRSKKYMEDYQKYENERKLAGDQDCAVAGGIKEPFIKLGKSGQELCHKWGLQCPLNPFMSVIYLPDDGVQRKPPTDLWFDFAPIRNPRQKELIELLTFISEHSSKFTVLKSGRLLVSVDLSFPFDTLVKEFEQIIKQAGAQSSKKTALRKQDYNIWEVYDLVEGADGIKRTYWEVAKNLECNREENGEKIYNDGIRCNENDEKKVERSYKKALKIIRFLETEALSR